MNLFSSFIFPSNSFLSWINKSALGLAGVWTGLILSCYFGISLRCLLYWTILSASKSFPENPPITLYLFSESSKIQLSLHPPETSFFFSYQFLFLSHTLFFFLLESSIKFWLSTKVSSFSAGMLFFIIDTHAHMRKNYIGKDSYLAWSVYMRENKK